MINSIVSRNKLSISAPSVYLDKRGNRIKKPCQSLYASEALASTEIPDAVGGGVIGMKIEFGHKFEDIISQENLLAAWQEFVRGKRMKRDVQLFQYNLVDNILQLHNDLANKTYKHGGYYNFNVSDPKPRKISKAPVKDRLVHHAVHRILYPFFDKIFIYDSYSCRKAKGTHKAIRRFHSMFQEVSNYNRKTCWVLKLDIKKFFASIDHQILIQILKDYIPDQEIMWLLEEIIDSFGRDCFVASRNSRKAPRKDGSLSLRAEAKQELNIAEAKQSHRKGLPLGNLTSQLFVNVYMNKFDQFMKNNLNIQHCIRYADDFVILSQDRKYLENLIPTIQNFLKDELKLILHPDKIILKTFASGLDFLGWINFPKHKVLRTATKKRMLRRINDTNLNSYLGLIKHGNTHRIQKQLTDLNWLLTPKIKQDIVL